MVPFLDMNILFSKFINFSKQRFCKNFAFEWANDVIQAALHNSSTSVDKQDPQSLPPIDIRSGSNKRRYNDGYLHNLKRYWNEIFELKNTQ